VDPVDPDPDSDPDPQHWYSVCTNVLQRSCKSGRYRFGTVPMERDVFQALNGGLSEKCLYDGVEMF
jgi:hypothetical protein